jgi:hypothetical protein
MVGKEEPRFDQGYCPVEHASHKQLPPWGGPGRPASLRSDVTTLNILATQKRLDHFPLFTPTIRRTKMKLLTFAALFLVASCARQEGDQIVAIQEAVFRYQFEHNASVVQQRADAFYLALGDPHEKTAIDPPAEFLARFAALKPRIAGYSEAERNETGWVIDKKTKKAGVIFFVHSIRKTGPDTAEAKGGYQEDKLSASGNTYHLKFGWRGWCVVGASMDWISEYRPNKRAMLRTAMAHH